MASAVASRYVAVPFSSMKTSVDVDDSLILGDVEDLSDPLPLLEKEPMFMLEGVSQRLAEQTETVNLSSRCG